MAHAGEDHGDPGLVGCADHVFVLLAAAGLHDRRHARFGGGLHAVREGEERVGGEHAALRARAALLAGDLDGGDACGLTAADADSLVHARARARAGEHDGIALHVFAHAPREHEASELGLRRRAFGHHLTLFDFTHARRVALLDHEAAADALVLTRLVRRAEPLAGGEQ